MIEIGEVYQSKEAPNRRAIIERLVWYGPILSIYYRVPLDNEGHESCSLDETLFLHRYYIIKGVRTL